MHRNFLIFWIIYQLANFVSISEHLYTSHLSSVNSSTHTIYDRRTSVTTFIEMFFSLILLPFILIFLTVLYYLKPWLENTSIRNIPGPRVAAFTNLWLLYQCRRGRRYIAVDEAHKEYGTLVRIQPNHVSVADDEAINSIYGHGNGFLKR